MAIRISRSLRFGAVLGSLTLAGCFGGEPGPGDILDAIQKHEEFRLLVEMNVNLGNPGRSIPYAEIIKRASIDKLGCAKAQNAQGYVCDFRFGLRDPKGTVHYNAPAKARFINTSSGWAAVQ